VASNLKQPHLAIALCDSVVKGSAMN